MKQTKSNSWFIQRLLYFTHKHILKSGMQKIQFAVAQ